MKRFTKLNLEKRIKKNNHFPYFKFSHKKGSGFNKTIYISINLLAKN